MQPRHRDEARRSRPVLAPQPGTAAPETAVLIPCHNEEAAIDTVVRGFRAALPHAVVHVYDNDSTDRTVERARAAGAVVRREPARGKGNVVRRMFADVDAEVYVLVDGDDTYDAGAAPRLVDRLVAEQLDMVNGARVAGNGATYRFGHRLGNVLLTWIVGVIFGDRFSDMLSGYRVLSRRFVKSFPAITGGFEIETELTVHALELRMPTAEVAVAYRERPPGSVSKLRTFRDGLRILRTILLLVRKERPLAFFAAVFGLLAGLSLALAAPVLLTYLRTGLVPRLPTALLATGVMLLAFLSLTCGLILDTVTLGRHEVKRMRYLEIPAPGGLDRRPPPRRRSPPRVREAA